MSLLLALLYPFAMLYKRGGWWQIVYVITLPAYVLDIIVNYTELALLTWDFPRKGEYTFSKRLQRLQYNTDFRGWIAHKIIPFLDYFDPEGKHIHA